jgi:hypothetical protein
MPLGRPGAFDDGLPCEHGGMAIRDDYVIRPARLSDAGAITELLAQLGYPDAVANVSARLESLDAHPGRRSVSR